MVDAGTASFKERSDVSGLPSLAIGLCECIGDISADDDREESDMPASVPSVAYLGSRVADVGRLATSHQPPTIGIVMQQTSIEAASRNYQFIFDSALEAYERRTGKDLTKDPLLRTLETCRSPDAVLILLRAQIFGPGRSQNNSDKLTTWLIPTINVISVFSETIGGAASLVSLTMFEVINPRSAL
jgi:hypothetical protein